MAAIETDQRDAVPVVRLESEWLQVEVASSVGGRSVSLVEKTGGYEVLWRNGTLPLQRLAPGSGSISST